MLRRFLDENAGIDADYDDAENGTTRRPFQWRWYHIALILLVIFPYISIFVLFGLVGNYKKTTNQSFYTTSTTTTFGSLALPTQDVAKVVSFSSSGALQLGCGTSVYLNSGPTVTAANCPSNPSLIAINETKYVLSYLSKNVPGSTLQLLTVSSTSTQPVATSVSGTASTYSIYEMTALSSSSGLFLAICQDLSASEETAFVIVGQVVGNAIVMSTAIPQPYSANYSVNPAIVALSSNSFAIAYYNTDPAVLAVAYGTVDTATQSVTFGAPIYYANDATYSHYFSISPLTSTTFMVLYYNSLANPGGSGPLNAAIATADPATRALAISTFTTLNSSSLSYYFTSTSIDSDTVVVAYAEAALNYALVARTVQLVDETEYGQQIVFGGAWIVSSGQAFTELPDQLLLDIDIQTVSSDQGDFIVLFSDVSNGGAMTLAVGQVTSVGQVKASSPSFVLFVPSASAPSYYAWGAMAIGGTEALSSQAMVLTMITNDADTTCTQAATTNVHILERMPGAIGVTSGTSSSASTISITGTISTTSSSSSFTAGKFYYGSTKGNLVAGEGYAGRNAGYCMLSNEAGGCEASGYVFDGESNALIAMDGCKVGLAVSSSTLSLSLT